MVRHDFTVFVVDDDESVLDSLKLLLESAGYQTRGFASAEELLASGSMQQASCLVLDIRLPGMSGYSLLEHLNMTGCSVPVIFITGHDRPGMKELAAKLGAAAYLPKPFFEQALLDAIQACCERCAHISFSSSGSVHPRH